MSRGMCTVVIDIPREWPSHYAWELAKIERVKERDDLNGKWHKTCDNILIALGGEPESSYSIEPYKTRTIVGVKSR